VRGSVTIARWSSYQVFGVVGYLMGLTLTSALAKHLGFGWSAHMVLALAPPLALLTGLLLGAVGIGRPEIVFYEKAAQALGATALALAATGQPVARGLDLAMLGIGTFLTFGRLGCFLVGCCHGRRARWGVRYGWQHANRSLPKRWVGMTLFPIQLVDAAASALGVAAGTALVWSARPPGSGLVAYVCVYAICRFAIEVFRGDACRRTYAGLSEAQWTSGIAVTAVACYRPGWWTLASVASLSLATLAFALARRRGAWAALWLGSGGHLAELDRVIGRLIAGGPAIATSERVRIQMVALADGCLELDLSRDGRPLSGRTLNMLASQLGRRWTVVALSPRVVIKAQVPTSALVAS
jgi:hypothetical protein